MVDQVLKTNNLSIYLSIYLSHAPDVCGFALRDMIHGCMVYTERAKTAAVSMQPCQRCKYTTSVDIQTNENKRALYSGE